MQTRRRPDGRTVAVLLATLMLAWATMDVVGGAVSPASGATAEPHWGPVVTLARDGQLSRPDVVVDEHGTETVAWSRAGSVVVTRRAAGGSWDPPIDLGEGSDPQLGIDRDGTVTIVWSRNLLGQGPQVMTARHAVAGRWSAVVALSPAVAEANGHGAFGPVLAVSRGGAVVVSWLWNEEDSGAAQAQARYRPAGRRWSAVTTLSPVEAAFPVCAIDARGRPAVAYVINGSEFVVRRVAGTWRAPRRVGRHGQPPQVAVDDAGDIVVAWSGLQPDGIFRPVAATRRIGGVWLAPVVLDPTLNTPLTNTEPAVVMGPRGRSTAAWARPDGSVMVADRFLGGTWTSPRQVAPAGDRVQPFPPALQLNVGRSGAALLSWTRETDTAMYVEAAYRPKAQDWRAPQRLSRPTLRGAAAEGFVRRGDRAVVVWRAVTATSEDVVQLRRLHP
jgi:hypothetical protein